MLMVLYTYTDNVYVYICVGGYMLERCKSDAKWTVSWSLSLFFQLSVVFHLKQETKWE